MDKDMVLMDHKLAQLFTQLLLVASKR